MILGSGALKVSGEGPEEYKHCREATRQAGTTQAALPTGAVTLKLVKWKYLPSQDPSQVAIWEGRAGLMNPQRIASEGPDPQRSWSAKLYMICPCELQGHPTDHAQCG